VISHTVLLNQEKVIVSAGLLSYLQGLGFLRAGLSTKDFIFVFLDIFGIDDVDPNSASCYSINRAIPGMQ